MNIEQSKLVQSQIDNLLKSDIDKRISEIYKDQSEIDKIQISRLSTGEFISLTKRVLKQIEKEIHSENRFVLPFVYNVLEVGQYNLDQAISILNSQISNNQLTNAENTLFWLSQYALNNGFYDRSKYKLHAIENFKVQEQKDKLDLLTENFKNLNIAYSELLEKIATTRSDIEKFQNQKIEELQSITNNLSNSTNNSNQINELLNQSTINNTKISSLLEQIDKEKLRVENLNNETQTKFNDLTSNYNILLSELQESDSLYKKHNDNFQQRLEFVENKTDYFNERNMYLDNLIGREVGASLFETFKQRKSELNKPLNFWRWSVIAMGIISFVIVLALFTNFFGKLGPIPAISWESIVVNFLKSTPILFLLYYAISQYNKERNFQEEYAFKSASALTIKAYSDILKEDINKDQLILKAVYNVYKSPISNKKYNSKKDINNIKDALGDLVDKAKDIIKTAK
ncbi:MAG: hypothetical protein BGO31_06160 [Bacteroidetes bacterium 43-16]|nr:MAG: hypothetical protein BGO31_06160 [Bacteroidetes bacterium 43-16]